MLKRVVHNIKQNFLEEHDRWILWLPVFYGIGIGVYFGLYEEPPLYVALALPVAALALLIFTRRNLVSIIILTIALGFMVAKINTGMMQATIVPHMEHPVTVSGNISDITSSKGFPVLFLKNLRIDEFGGDVPRELKLSVRTKFKEPVTPGDRIITNAMLMPPPRPAIPGGYDFAKFSYFDGEGATGFAVAKITKLKEGGEENKLQDLRYNISGKLRAALPGDEGALVDALTTGNRTYLSEDAHNNLRKSGLAHLLAIAGMHQALAGGFIFLLARLLMSLSPVLSEAYPTKKIAAVFAIGCNFFYLLISGMPYSAVRAFIMFALFMVGIVFDRRSMSVRSLALAAFIILTFCPQALIGPSFQMSFAAVLALISVYEIMSRRALRKIEEDENKEYHHKWHIGHKVWEHARAIALTSLIAGLATAPYSIFHFTQFVNYGILANLMVMPITAFVVMPCIVLAMFLMPLGLHWLPLIPAGWGIGWILQIGAWVTSLPHSTFHIPQMPLWGLLVITFGGLWFLIWRGRWRWYGFIFIFLGALSPLTATMPDIIINENGKFFAINYGGKLYFSKTRTNFTVKNWLQIFVQDEKLPLEVKDVYQIKNYNFSAGSDNCDFEIKGDSGAVCITDADLEKNGTYNIYLRDDKIVVETVEGRRGNRPWTAHAEIENPDDE